MKVKIWVDGKNVTNQDGSLFEYRKQRSQRKEKLNIKVQQNEDMKFGSKICTVKLA